jgi:uncharacterized protein
MSDGTSSDQQREAPPEMREQYGPWALVVGASEGVGAAFAARLADAGLNVALLSRRSAPLEELAAELRDRSRVDTRVLAVDLFQPDAASRVLEGVADLEIGLVIFNAGADDHGCDFLDAPLDEWLDLVRRNVVATTTLCHHLAQPMRDRGRGGLILVSSGAGWSGAGRIAIYSATKAYDRNLAEGLWYELGAHGVHVLSLVLNPTDTPALRRLLESRNLPPAGLDDSDTVARLGLERLPLGPIYSVGEENGGVEPHVQADQRRERVVAVSNATSTFFGG